jgi:hypothetical protein
MFNVDRLWPYFPPLLDTSDMEKQLRPTELNLDCMEQDTIDQIMDTYIKRTQKQNVNFSKKANSFTKASGSPGTKFSRSSLIS